MKNRDFLEIAEYFALALFIFGVVFAVYLKDVLWAAAPLVLYILLNIYNRSQLDRLTKQSLKGVSKLDNLEAGVEELKAAIQQLSQNDQKPLLESIGRNLENLAGAIPSLQQRLDAQGKTVEGALNQLETLNQQLYQQDQSQQLDSVRQTLANLSASISDLQQHLNQLTVGSLLSGAESLPQTPATDSRQLELPWESSENQDVTSPDAAINSSAEMSADQLEDSSESREIPQTFPNPEEGMTDLLPQPNTEQQENALENAEQTVPDSEFTDSTVAENLSAEYNPQHQEAASSSSENLYQPVPETEEDTSSAEKESSLADTYAAQLAAQRAEQLLSRYQQGERDFTRVNLSGAILQNAYLEGVDLKYSVLNKVDLRGANLDSAILQAADLIEADLRGANMANADLDGVNLSGADLRTTNLRDAYLRGANLSDADLCGANLANASLRGANLFGAKLYPADMVRADLAGAIMPDGSIHN